MTPIFFGDSSSPLFGVYRPPAAGEDVNKAVLVCSPIAHEHIRSYSAIKTLAKLLSGQGCHVLTFDYSGVGDSFGEMSEMSIDRWVEDISVAYSELVDISGVKNVSLVGVRLGGLLSGLASKNLKLKNIVMWDPVLSGRMYINNIKKMHKDMLDGKVRFNCPRSLDSQNDEFLGFVYGDDLVEDIESATFDVNDLSENIINAYFSTESEDYHLAKNNSLADAVVVEDAGDWENIGKIEDILLANIIPNNIAKDI